jgi:phthalate 4,5-cis-dihydrodiol dehydrogenase
MTKLRLGVAGLGRAFTLTLPGLMKHARVALVAAADPRDEARRQFSRDFGAPTYETVEAMCADAAVDAIYVATPHAYHAAHSIAAARAGKHVLVEKPMALSLDEAAAMIGAAREANVKIVVGPSHSFDAPIAHARRIVASGELGRVRMVTAVNYTDFLYRPRRPEDLDTSRGGGVLLSQAAHQVDIVRLLAGGRAKNVRALAGAWDPARPTEGAYAALLTFDGGAFASLTYSGYAHFDSDELCGWMGELGRAKDPQAYGAGRAALARLGGMDEAAARHAGNYGGAHYRGPGASPISHEHFGFIVVSCDHGDIRPMPNGVWIYGNERKRFEELPPPTIPRAEVLDELCSAVLDGTKPLHGPEWGMASLEVCLAMLRSAQGGEEIVLTHQVAAPS